MCFLLLASKSRNVKEASSKYIVFTLYSGVILRELENTTGFLIGGHTPNKKGYEDNTVLIVRELDELLQTVL